VKRIVFVGAAFVVGCQARATGRTVPAVATAAGAETTTPVVMAEQIGWEADIAGSGVPASSERLRLPDAAGELPPFADGIHCGYGPVMVEKTPTGFHATRFVHCIANGTRFATPALCDLDGGRLSSTIGMLTVTWNEGQHHVALTIACALR
jgi:hypothetical protein